MTSFYCTFYNIQGDTITSHHLQNVPNVGDKIKPGSGYTYIIKDKVQVLKYVTDPVEDYEEFEFIVEEISISDEGQEDLKYYLDSQKEWSEVYQKLSNS